MARLKSPVQRRVSAAVKAPAAFLDHTDEVWLNPTMFVEFMRGHGFTVHGAEVQPGRWVDNLRPEQRLELAVGTWARDNDMTMPFNPAYPAVGVTTDWLRLRAEFGIRRPRRLRVVATQLRGSSL